MMRPNRQGIGRMAAAAILALALASCSDYDNVSAHGSVGMYYGSGYYDPWNYGPGYYRPPVIVAPPPSRPPSRPPARPPMQRPTPLPARPMPRPMPRGR
jgi:hypothetical protein